MHRQLARPRERLQGGRTVPGHPMGSYHSRQRVVLRWSAEGTQILFAAGNTQLMGVSPRTLSLALLAALGVVGMSFAAPLGPTAGASPTAKVDQIDGVPLVPAPRSQIAECRDLARQLHRAVPCPGLVPEPIPNSPTAASGYCLTSRACGPAQVSVYRTSLLMTQMNFQVPKGYVGVSIGTYQGWVSATASNGGPLGHFVFETGSSLLGEYKPHSIRAAASIPSYCLPIQGQRAVRIHGSPSEFFECANSSNDPNAMKTVQGHDLLQWKQDGMVNQVSFHGHSEVNLDLDLAVAQSVKLIR